MIKSLKDLLDKFSRFTNSLVYDGGICKRLKDIDFYLEHNKEDSYSSSFEKDDDVIDWDNIFKQFDCLTSENIQEAYDYFRENTKYVDHAYFFEEMRKRIDFDNRKQNLDSFVNCDYDIKTIIDQIAEYYKDWNDSVAIKKYIPKLIENIFLNQSVNILDSYWLSVSLDTAEKLTGKSRTNLILKLLEKGLENIQSYSYELILRLVNEFKNLITPEETKELLTFGIEQFQENLEDDSSDGIWQDNLTPPFNINDTLGAFIYIALGSTKAEDRWRAMYTVKMLYEFEEKEILSSILKQLEQYNSSFIGQQFEFYDMHAKLYLFISLARVALDDSKVLKIYSNVFKHYAVDWLPHVLIRKYSVNIALSIEQQFPSTYTIEDLELIKEKNISKFPIQIITSEERYSKKRVKTKIKKDKRLHFGIDWEPYWFEDLANAFNIPISDISQMTENLILDDWGYDEKFEHWDYDLRAKYKIFIDDMKTDIWKSDYPQQDGLSFYVIYHAMFCVAGKLFDSHPVFYDEEYEDNLWEDFLSRHTLTRKDNKWVSDRKDFFPTDLYRDYKELLKNNNWQFSVTHNDFDKVLKFKENDFQYLPIYGSWEYSSEEISIQSVFVSETNSYALLRALQTVENPRDFYLAPDQDRRIVQKDQFEMFGVIEDYDSLELKLDQFDPLAKIRYPGLKPAEYIIEKFELQSDEENRIWKSAQSEVFISELWSDYTGRRLQINYEYLLHMLTVLEKDLLINVEIKREKKSYHQTYDPNKIYYPPYFKLYLFKKDGTVHELYKNYKIR